MVGYCCCVVMVTRDVLQGLVQGHLDIRDGFGLILCLNGSGTLEK